MMVEVCQMVYDGRSVSDGCQMVYDGQSVHVRWVTLTAMKLRSAVLTFPLMHVISLTVIIYSLLPGNA